MPGQTSTIEPAGTVLTAEEMLLKLEPGLQFPTTKVVAASIGWIPRMSKNIDRSKLSDANLYFVDRSFFGQFFEYHGQ